MLKGTHLLWLMLLYQITRKLLLLITHVVVCMFVLFCFCYLFLLLFLWVFCEEVNEDCIHRNRESYSLAIGNYSILLTFIGLVITDCMQHPLWKAIYLPIRTSVWLIAFMSVYLSGCLCSYVCFVLYFSLYHKVISWRHKRKGNHH